MKIATIVLSSLSALMLLSTLICGLWMRSQATVAPDSVRFHMNIGVASVILVIITLGLVMIQALRG